jgi:ubiquinone/menaquinone biosynthesis C-methylase UbiE
MNPIQAWKDFQDRSLYYQAVRRDGEEPVWQEIAKDYDRLVYSEQQKETLLTKLTHRLHGIETAIEIGAGSGTLTLPLVRHLREIAAVEPSAAMAAALHASLAEHKIRNVSVFQEKWENMQPAAADVVLAGGCLYVFYEIDKVLRKMLACAKKKVLITHVGNCGLWHFDRLLLERLGAPKPCLFPPLSLLLDVLLHLQLPAMMDITFAKGRKCFTPEQWLRRCQRLLQLAEPPPVLLDFLMQEFSQDGDCWSMEEEVPLAVIELRKTP